VVRNADHAPNDGVTMHFSWIGFWVAPLVVPLIGAAVIAPLMNGEGTMVGPFFLFLILASIISYGTMIFLFLPALFLLSLSRPLTGWMACTLGTALGIGLVAPIIVFTWASSGPDSGPPVENFLTFFVRWFLDPFMLIFPAAGLVTAALYWWLGTRHNLRANHSAPKN